MTSWAKRAIPQCLAAWKWCLSFRKDDWSLDDYPIATRMQEPDTNDSNYTPPRFSQHRYIASIINWHISAGGETQQQAIDNLRANLQSTKEARRQEGKTLPRPGTRVPIEFASQEKVYAHPALVNDFIQRVLGLDWAWISDESSLWDFHADTTNDVLVSKIKEIYGVDVSDIHSAELWEILDRIAAS